MDVWNVPPMQADLSFLFDNLPHLSALSMTYGARNVGMDYERSLFGMKLTDAASLARELRKNESLTSLTLSCNLLDDEKTRTLVLGLMENHTITSLDLSHNKIADRGVRFAPVISACSSLPLDSIRAALALRECVLLLPGRCASCSARTASSQRSTFATTTSTPRAASSSAARCRLTFSFVAQQLG